MKLTSQEYGQISVLTLQGEFDAEFTEMFRRSVSDTIAHGGEGIILELGDVSFIDSAGLETLLWAKDYCVENTVSFKLAVLNENCSRILELTRLDKDFDTYIEVTEALKSFG